MMGKIIEKTSKFILCVLMTQMGKTFTAISKILTLVKQDDELGRSIHVVFTMNTLLNNKQFAKRLETIEKTYGEGSICVFSSKYDGKYKHVKNRDELQGVCANKATCPRVVVMCSNKKRYKDGVDFIKVLDKNNISGIVRVFAYYDELHKYINPTLRNEIEEIHNLEIIKGITALTASPDKIFEDVGFWSTIELIQLDDFSDTNYVGYKDMVFNCVDDFFANPYVRPSAFDFEEKDKQTLGFITSVLTKYPEILGDGTRSFIPAHIRQAGHNAVRDLVFKIKKNAVVVVLNGFEKTLQYKDDLENTKTLPLTSCDEEACETISRLVIHHNLQYRPIVITGLLCVGMGQTLAHKSLGSFTSAIFGHMDLTNDDIYQLFGRITGRMKNWESKYIQTQVYCPTTIMNRCIVMEECARNMASNHNGEYVTQEIYREPMSELGDIGKSAIDNIRAQKKRTIKVVTEDTDKDSMVFDTQKKAIEFGRTIGCKFSSRKENAKAPATLMKDGKNPTREQLLKRMWGIDDKNRGRMVPTLDNKWCIYWRPSLIKSE
jgi:hypothetical protein